MKKNVNQLNKHYLTLPVVLFKKKEVGECGKRGHSELRLMKRKGGEM